MLAVLVIGNGLTIIYASGVTDINGDHNNRPMSKGGAVKHTILRWGIIKKTPPSDMGEAYNTQYNQMGMS